ncbi:hypothetical protein [Ruminococcus sp.]|uniref:ArnT family glycosyltransferase n=1 Tax=Ruminococcus sp. TaxID=41978 RepID=UPI0025D443B6|nr:hypothetical protein [Ruminococcus sp.]
MTIQKDTKKANKSNKANRNKKDSKNDVLSEIRKVIDRRAISDRRLEAIFKNISNHPYLIAAFLSFALAGFGCYGQYYISGFSVYFVFALAEFFYFRRLLKGLGDSAKNHAACYLSFAGKSLFTLAATIYFVGYQSKAAFVCFVGVIAVLIAYVVLLNNDKKFVDRVTCLCLAAAGFVLRYSYVLETDIYTRQNDVWFFGEEGGHAGYIEYLYNNHALPNFDPTTLWQYYHPPLHHIICAVWLKFCTAFGIEYYMACEALQGLTLFYISAVVITFYKLLKLFDLKGKALTIPFGIGCMFPYLAIMSGGINNDPLMLCFTMGAIYCVIKWYREQTAKNIAKAALCIGFGMMTKVSVALIAPAVAIVFLIALFALFKSGKKALNRLGQFCVFALISFPLGLWWSIRNYLRFGVKPNYVPMLSEEADQFLGEFTTKQRFTDFGFYQFKKVFEQWGGESYKEHNPTIAFIKNSLFGEEISESHFPKSGLIVPNALFWVALILAVISFIAMFIVLVKKTKGANFVEKLLLCLVHLTILGSYYHFCAKYKFICTMNFRYIVPCMLIGLLNIGIFAGACQNAQSADIGAWAKKFCKGAVSLLGYLSAAFVALSYVMMFLVISSNG